MIRYLASALLVASMFLFVYSGSATIVARRALIQINHLTIELLSILNRT